jgi:hypothetical protein
MTRKDYELLANTFAKTKPTPEQFPDEAQWRVLYSQWEMDIRTLCDALGAANPRFDRGRFQYAATSAIFIDLPRFNDDGSLKPRKDPRS